MSVCAVLLLMGCWCAAWSFFALGCRQWLTPLDRIFQQERKLLVWLSAFLAVVTLTLFLIAYLKYE